MVAFVIGKQYQPGSGVHVVGAHTDSPNLRIRPVSKRSKEGYLQCSVETYGGGLWHTWFDRDLSLAGRVIVSTSKDHNQFESRLVHIRRPLLRVPTLAIHLNRSANEAFKFNQEEQLQPIFGLADQLNQPSVSSDVQASSAVGTPSMASKHHPALLQLLAHELDVPVDFIQDFELSLFDTQPPAAGGVNNEFIFTPRVDNQMSCFCSTEALIASVVDLDALEKSKSIRAIALFDNEEVGSVSNHGAESNLLWSLIQRLAGLQVPGVQTSAVSSTELVEQSLSRSFLISSDTAHGAYLCTLTAAVHPNYASIHEDHLRPVRILVLTLENERRSCHQDQCQAAICIDSHHNVPSAPCSPPCGRARARVRGAQRLCVWQYHRTYALQGMYIHSHFRMYARSTLATRSLVCTQFARCVARTTSTTRSVSYVCHVPSQLPVHRVLPLVRRD